MTATDTVGSSDKRSATVRPAVPPPIIYPVRKSHDSARGNIRRSQIWSLILGRQRKFLLVSLDRPPDRCSTAMELLERPRRYSTTLDNREGSSWQKNQVSWAEEVRRRQTLKMLTNSRRCYLIICFTVFALYWRRWSKHIMFARSTVNSRRGFLEAIGILSKDP